ncbi:MULTISPECIES: translation initiation factor Sui1 [Halomonas]|uniref:Translation initiation factor Sui1 n=1 Tax=Halomonas casei TaxID=2742613 RepID=A0ABR9F609_9GAMM|nr:MULTISPECIES: translation initiation factor Sui1 [Halomonas]MBE0401927.1 translation initiation factor Sui1 [Halomonas casei]PCC20670.1 stress response translation initiation inhibitor YciH [Halomonas sp. JB37]
MASLRDQLGGLVYSTEHGKTCPTCREALDACNCDNASELERLAALDGVVRIRRETSGRKGKGVTTVSGIPLPSDDLKRLAKTLKQRCGTGGAVKEGIIEIQGDHRDTLHQALSALGYQVKFAGG